MEKYDSEKEIVCTYKGEIYSVRDNGAILRHPKNSNRPRPNDNVWTFGKPDEKTGYLNLSGERVHRIVATAFHGDSPSEDYVVDHIDTNRKNNRPENLRWVTRLENILDNPNTRKKIIAICGSIEAFLKDPSCLSNVSGDSNFKWMRTVTAEEAHISSEKLKEWAESDRSPSGGSFDERLFHSKQYAFQSSKYERRNWKTPTDFPNVPQIIEGDPIKAYFDKLTIGMKFSWNQYGKYIVDDISICEDGKSLFVLSSSEGNIGQSWAIAKVTFENGKFVHESKGTFFHKDEAIKKFKNPQGLEATSGGSFGEWVFETKGTDFETSSPDRRNWNTPTEFPNVPQKTEDNPIKAYFDKLTPGVIFSRNHYGKYAVEDVAIYDEGKSLYVITCAEGESLKPWALAKVTFENGIFVHESISSYFHRDGADKYFTLAQGLEWTGGEVFDDLC